MPASVNLVYDTKPGRRLISRRVYTTEQNVIIRTDESQVEDRRLIMRSGHCTIEANYRQTRNIARPLCDSIELVVLVE